jgi:undecaprenyl-phosphate galactose phosphotransferase
MSTRDVTDADGYSVERRLVSHRSPATAQVKHNPGAPNLDAKRVFDIVGALIALVFFGPIMILIFVALLFCGGAPIFAHSRVGQHGRMFRCFKFRSMRRNADSHMARYLERNSDAREEWNRAFKLQCDPRITPWGSFLRRTSLDELPQLFNVLRGEMSLVGPRPIVPAEVERYQNFIGAYYECRPGITGLWQISGRNNVCYNERVRLDALYAGKRSVSFDVVILFRTVWVVLTRHGAY